MRVSPALFRARSSCRRVASCPRANRLAAVVVAASAAMIVTAAVEAAPQYAIFNIGTVQPGDTASQGFRVSPNGIATGRSVGSPTQAFTWTEAGGIVGLPNLATPARAFSVGNGVNSNGVVVGTGATTSFGSNPLPLIWQGGTVSQLPLPAGQSIGRANDVNASNVVIGSVNSGSAERAFIVNGANSQIITTTTASGCFFFTAFGISNNGIVVGNGIDPNNAARNVPFVYNSVANTATEVPVQAGFNSGLLFDVSADGTYIGGLQQLNQGAGQPIIWSSGTGTVQVPLPANTSSASVRGVNNDGWAVGTASGQFAVPYLYDGSLTYRLQDLIAANSGWDISTNTSSSALGVSDTGVIVGTGVFNGQVRAYAMVPVPEPTTIGMVGLAAVKLLTARRRRP